MNSRIALATVIGIGAITVADAPNWKMRSYLGYVGAMAASGFIAAADQSLGEALAILVLGAVLLRRGESLGRKAETAMGSASSVAIDGPRKVMV